MTVVYTNTSTYSGATWASSASVGGMALVSRQTASNSSEIIFTGLSNDFSCYYMVISGVGPSVAASDFRVDVSTNNGSSWLSSGYTNGIDAYTYNSTTSTNTNSTTFIPLTSAMTSNTYVGSFFLYNANIGSGITLGGQGTWSNGGPASTGFYTGQGPTGVNAIRFKFSTGNIAAGTFSLYSVA